MRQTQFYLTVSGFAAHHCLMIHVPKLNLEYPSSYLSVRSLQHHRVGFALLTIWTASVTADNELPAIVR